MKAPGLFLLLSLVIVPGSICRGQSSGDVVPLVNNPAKAPKTQTVRLDELWRIGEGDDPDAFVFGGIGDVIGDAQGRTFVLDWQTHQVSVFSPEGDLIRTMGREGEGPGEFRQPIGLVLLPYGLLGVVRGQPPAIVCFRVADGTFVENLYFAADPAHPFQMIGAVKHRVKTFVIAGADIREGVDGMDITTRLMRFDAEGRFLGECDSTTSQFSRAHPVVKEQINMQWAIGPDDQLFVNRGLEYRFDVYGPNCRAERVIAREYKSRKRTNAEMDAVIDYYRRVGNIGNSKLEIPDVVRDVYWFSIDDVGRLWVQNSRGRVDIPEDSLGVFDVYDPKGRLDRVVDLKADREPRDRYYLTGGRFYVVHPEALAVVAYRMPEL